jgi:hypothetical protein
VNEVEPETLDRMTIDSKPGEGARTEIELPELTPPVS